MAAPTATEDLQTSVGAAVEAMLPDLRGLYEDLHAHPELSFAEHRTAGIVAGRLQALGYDVTTGVGRTGLVATLDRGEGPTVLLRADMDALPVAEDTGLPYASTVVATDASGTTVPVAHACGHDMHVTWLLGAAALLVGEAAAWSGRVVLVLQPAEEVGSGAAAMIADDLFERFGTPDVALGQHLAPAPAGWLLFRPGAVMAASDSLRVVLHGRGAHGAAPEQSVDPVVMAASTIMRLQTVVSREIAAADQAVVTVGSVHAGTKENIIADDAELMLSVRTFEPSIRQRVLAAVTRIVHGEAQTAGAATPPEIAETWSTPVVFNDPTATDRVAHTFIDYFGPSRAMPGPATSASEDFGLFGSGAGCPSVFWFVGGTDADRWGQAFAAGRLQEDIPFNHSPRFAPVQDPTITAGIEALYVAALAWLG
jgi:amidohydrolase